MAKTFRVISETLSRSGDIASNPRSRFAALWLEFTDWLSATVARPVCIHVRRGRIRRSADDFGATDSTSPIKFTSHTHRFRSGSDKATGGDL